MTRKGLGAKYIGNFCWLQVKIIPNLQNLRFTQNFFKKWYTSYCS